MGRQKSILSKTSDEILIGYGLKADKKRDNEFKEKEDRRVYLRGKVLSSGNVSLFLDYCSPTGKREKRYLKNILCLETSKEIKDKNKETLRISRTIASEADASAQRDENGCTIPSGRGFEEKRQCSWVLLYPYSPIKTYSAIFGRANHP